jgi:hypothetical protein
VFPKNPVFLGGEIRMMRDFTLDMLRHLITAIKEKKYVSQTFAGFIKDPAPKSIVFRHDVDARKMNSLQTAILEKELGVTGTYYFRMTPEIFNADIIREISSLGHEIGYHYEDLAAERGNYDRAICRFEKNLSALRKIVTVETICMHGSPLSGFDNRKLWGKFSYRDYGITGEPYFDINFEEVLYLSDTGRRWDGDSFSIRDKPVTSNQQPVTFPKFHSTSDIILALEKERLPEKIMITIHPQRWDDRTNQWIKELVWQNVKNVAKRILKDIR